MRVGGFRAMRLRARGDASRKGTTPSRVLAEASRTFQKRQHGDLICRFPGFLCESRGHAVSTRSRTGSLPNLRDRSGPSGRTADEHVMYT
jgi:hypothetical protein